LLGHFQLPDIGHRQHLDVVLLPPNRFHLALVVPLRSLFLQLLVDVLSVEVLLNVRITRRASSNQPIHLIRGDEDDPQPELGLLKQPEESFLFLVHLGLGLRTALVLVLVVVLIVDGTAAEGALVINLALALGLVPVRTVLLIPVLGHQVGIAAFVLVLDHTGRRFGGRVSGGEER